MEVELVYRLRMEEYQVLSLVGYQWSQHGGDMDLFFVT